MAGRYRIATRPSAAHKSQRAGNCEKRRPPCRHGGLEFREETPKEGICGRSCRTATISPRSAAVASVFFALWMTDARIRSTVAFLSECAYSEEDENKTAISMI